MQKKEANFGLLFRHWIKANPQETAAYELKQTSTNRIPFSALEEHQEEYLHAVRNGKVLTRVQGTNGEPDYIYLNKVRAFVVVKFPTEFHLIDILNWIPQSKYSASKSLTITTSRKIASKIVKL